MFYLLLLLSAVAAIVIAGRAHSRRLDELDNLHATAADEWLKDNDPEGVAFEHDVLDRHPEGSRRWFQN